MSAQTLYRLSGWSLLLGGAVTIILNIVNNYAFPSNNSGFDPSVVTAAPFQIVNLLLFVGGILTLLGAPGIYLRQARKAGVLGLIGFILLFITGILLGLVFEIIDVLVIPWIASVAPKLAEGSGPPSLFVFFLVAGLLATVAALLFGIATLRAAILPRGAAIVLLVAAIINLLNFAPFPPVLSNLLGTASPVLYGLALAWFGYGLLAERREGVAQAPVPRTDTQVPA